MMLRDTKQVGIEAPKTEHNKPTTTNSRGMDPQRILEGQGAGGVDAAKGEPAGAGGVGGNGAVVGGGGPGSLLPEGAPAKGLCSPPKETRDDLHT